MLTFYHIKFGFLEDSKFSFPMALLTTFYVSLVESDLYQNRAVWRMAIPPDDSFKGFDFCLLSALT